MMKLPDALPELQAILGTDEFEANGRMRVVAAHWSADRLDIRLHVADGTGQISGWSLRFRDVLEYNFANVYNCGLNVWRDDHPAIAQYVDTRAFLHFAHAPRDPSHVIGELWSAHVDLVDDWIPFDRYLNREIPLLRLLSGGSGLVATGPAFIVSAYANVLEAEDCQPVVQELPRSRTIDTATLVHFGECYVICASVLTKRIAA
jgi:hypothetical protein